MTQFYKGLGALSRNLTGPPFLLGFGKDRSPVATNSFGFRNCMIINVHELPKRESACKTGNVGNAG